MEHNKDLKMNNKTCGRSARRTVYIAAAFFAMSVLLLSGCKALFNPLGAEGQLLTVRLGAAAERSATVGYAMPQVAGYELYGAKSGSEEAWLGSWTAAQMAANPGLTLQAGTWNFTLTATDAEGKTVLQGALQNQALSESIQLNFTISPLLTGMGTVDLSLVWPLTQDVASVVVYKNYVAQSPALTPELDAENGRYVVRYLDTAVAAGNARIRFELRNAAGTAVSGRSYQVWVRGNLTSSELLELENKHFNSPPEALQNLQALRTIDLSDLAQQSIVLSWESGSFTESSVELEYSEDAGTTWFSLVSLDAPVLAYTDTVPRGLSRSYRARTVNAYGNAEWLQSNVVSVPWLVSFNSNGGSSVAALEVADGQLLSEPTAPTQGSFGFGGWFSDSELDNAWDFATDTVTENLVLYAAWILVDNPASDFEYSISGGEVTITKYIGTATTVVIPASIEGSPVTAIADGTSSNYAFQNKSVVSVYLPDSLKKIGNNAFRNRTTLVLLKTGTGLESIGTSAFYLCSKLESISLSEATHTVDVGAFSSCSALREILVNPLNPVFSSVDGVLVKDGSILYRYPPAKNSASGTYTMPSEIQSIGVSAFSDAKIKELVMNEGLTSIENSAFSSSQIEAFYLPASLNSATSQSFSGSSKNQVYDVHPFNAAFMSYDGVLYSKDGKALISYPSAKAELEYTVPIRIEEISSYAFRSLGFLKELYLPDSLTTIRQWAFLSNNILEYVDLPASVTTIDFFSFSNNYNLADIVLRAETPPNAALYNFSYHAENLSIWVPGDSLAAYNSSPYWADATIQSYLKAIESGAGTLQLSISWPEGTAADSIAVAVNGSLLDPALSPALDAATARWSVSYTNAAAQVGAYTIEFWLKDSEANTVSSGMRELSIRNAKTSSLAVELSAADISAPPAAPASLSVAAELSHSSVDTSTLTLSWPRVNGTENGYRLESSSDAGSSWSLLADLAANESSYQDVVPRGAERIYRIAAQNTFGNSAWTQSAAIKAPWLVQFQSNGGGAVAAQEAVHGASISAPAEPTQPGYLFAGWFSDSDLNTVWDFATDGITENKTLYAAWTLWENPASDFEYTISGGEVTITRYTGTPVHVSIPALIEGYPVVALADGTSSAYVFKDKAIVSVRLPDSLRRIGSYAFYLRSTLVQFHAGSSLEQIGNYAFRYCSKLELAALNTALQSIGEYAFGGTSILSAITLPATLNTLAATAFVGASSMVSFDVDSENATFTSVDGVLFNKTQTQIVCFPAGRVDASWSVPSSVTSIGDYAFWGSKVDALFIPSTVTLIGERGLFSTTINTITMESLVPPSLGANAFASSDIYVAKQSVLTYRTAQDWLPYASYIRWEGYTFYNNATWFTGPDTAPYSYFGVSFAISGDGQTLVSLDFPGGGYETCTSARVLVFTRNGSGWTFVDSVDFPEFNGIHRMSCMAHKDNLAISYDGRTILFGNRVTDSAVILTSEDGLTWARTAELTAAAPVSDSNFASSVSLSDDGTVALVGALGSLQSYSDIEGKAYIFKADGAWVDMTETAVLSSSSWGTNKASFGYRVSLSADGNAALVSAPNDEDYVWGYSYVMGSQTMQYVHRPKSGSVFYFAVSGQNWLSMEPIEDVYTNFTGYYADDFGRSVSFSADGMTALIGGRNRAFILEREAGAWVFKARLDGSDPSNLYSFGDSAALSRDGNTALVGDYYNIRGSENYGAAYLYKKSTQWGDTIEDAKIYAPFTIPAQDADFFGDSLAFYPDQQTLLIGAWQARSGTVDETHAQGLIYIYDFD